MVTVSAKASDPDLSNNVVITAFTAEIPPSILLDPQSLVITNGDSDNLMVGRNGLFYDRKGRDWDATIAKIVLGR